MWATSKNDIKSIGENEGLVTVPPLYRLGRRRARPQRFRHMDLLKIDGDSRLQIFWEDGEYVVYRGWCLLLASVCARSPDSRTRLGEGLDERLAARPLGLVRDRGQITLVLQDPGGAARRASWRADGDGTLPAACH